MTSMRAIAVVAALCAILTSSATASVVRTIVRSSDNEESAGVGVQVAEEYVLTTHQFVSGASQVSVQADPSSAQIRAEIKAADPDGDLALLFVPGLEGEPATVAKEAPLPGRFVRIQALDGTTHDGVFVETVEVESQQRRYWFTSANNTPEPGSPLMNGCGELIAVGTRGSNPTGVGASQGVLSGTFPALVAFLLENGVRYRDASDPCPSLQERNASLQAEKAEAIAAGERLQQEKESLANELEELETTIAEGAQKSQEELESLEARRQQLAEDLRRKESELARQVSRVEEINKKQAETEARLKESEEDLRRTRDELQERDDELSNSQQREEEAREWASLLEKLLIVAAIAVVVALLVVAVMALKAHRRKSLAGTQEGGFELGGQRGTTHEPPLSPRETDRQPTSGPTASQGNQPLTGSSGDPKTTIGGFRPPPVTTPPPRPTPHPTNDLGPVARRADNPVVGWLVVVDGPGKGSEIVVGIGQNSVGRGQDARARVDFGDEEVSRGAHAMVTYDWRGNGFFLANGTGTNLTYVNGKALMEPVRLENGSEFRIGQTTLRFVSFCDDSFQWSDSNNVQ